MRRPEFKERAEAVLDFMDTYEVVTSNQLNKFFPGDEKAIDYLIRCGKLHISTDESQISNDSEPRLNKPLIAALGILADIFEKVQAHARAAPPVQISFLTHNNDYYEIIYVGYGLEAMVTASFEARNTAKVREKGHIYPTKRMVIVEDINQMERLLIPGTVRFAHVQPDGRLVYYKARS